MKKIKSFLKNIDSFGVPFSFKYKTKEKYRTSIGGLVYIIFCIFLLSFTIYYFVPFSNMKNFSSIYNTINIPNGEQINLKQSKIPLSFGLICNDNTDILSKNIFELNAKFINIKQNSKYSKNIINIRTHNCTYEDFNNEHNDYFDKFNLSNYKCLDNKDYIIEGSYLDEQFSYYEFNLNSNLNLIDINNFLEKNECRLQIIYTDININLNDYKNPIKSFLSSIYIDLFSSTLILQDIYFMKHYLFNDDYLFGVFNEENSKPGIYISFSRYEKYSIYKDNSSNDNSYARIYLKSDTRKSYIKRKYQKFIEFFADISSIFICIYLLLKIMVNYINNFFAYFSLSKKIFIFKDINNKDLDLKKKVLKINQLITLTNQYNSYIKPETAKDEKLDLDEIEIFKIKNDNINNMQQSENEPIKRNTDKDILLFQKRNKNLVGKNNSFNYQYNLNFYNIKKNIARDVHKYSNSRKDQKTYEISSTSKENTSNSKNNLNKEICSNIINSERSSETKKEDFINTFSRKKLNYKFNILEIIQNLMGKYCITNDLKLKNDLNNKVNQILFHKMDISVFLRNMYLFDIIIQIFFDSNKKYVMNFLSRPIINSKELNENELDDFYKVYNETEFVKSTLGIYKMLKIQNKKNSEQRLIALYNKQLKDIL